MSHFVVADCDFETSGHEQALMIVSRFNQLVKEHKLGHIEAATYKVRDRVYAGVHYGDYTHSGFQDELNTIFAKLSEQFNVVGDCYYSGDYYENIERTGYEHGRIINYETIVTYKRIEPEDDKPREPFANIKDYLHPVMKNDSENLDDETPYTPSATAGDYSPSNPWDAPGMSIHDFI